jgi:N-acetylneuraminic acid mutarotase
MPRMRLWNRILRCIVAAASSHNAAAIILLSFPFFWFFSRIPSPLSESGPQGESAWAAMQDAGSWRTAAPAPTKRTEVTAAAVAGKLYLMGGFSAPRLSNVLDLAITDLVEEYDTVADRWRTVSPMPGKLHHAGAVAIGERIYVVGGFTQAFLSVWHPVASLYIYHPASDTWVEGPPMPTARGALAVAELDGRMVAVGGYTDSSNTGAAELYDPVQQKWESLPSLSTARDHLAAAVWNGRVYAIGGRLDRDYGHNLATVEVYDSRAGQWTKTTDLPTPRSGITAAMIDDAIYVLGGESPEGTFSANEAYSPKTGRWSAMASMPTSRHGLGSAVVGQELFVVAGGPKPGGSFSNANEVFMPPAKPHAGLMSVVTQRITDEPSTEPRTRTKSQHVGSVMAMLATFDEAHVLPPENSPQANQVIKALIQFQSAFLKSRHPAVREFFMAAAQAKFGAEAGNVVAGFHQTGWTSAVMEALTDYGAQDQPWQGGTLADGLREYNVTKADFELLIELFRRTKQQLHARGEDVHQVYAARRRDMPGAAF